MPHDPLQMLTLKEASELLKVSYEVLLAAVNNPASGLKASDLSTLSGSQKKQWRVSRQSLMDWIEVRSNGVGKPKAKRRQRDDSHVIEFVK